MATHQQNVHFVQFENVIEKNFRLLFLRYGTCRRLKSSQEMIHIP